jgi:hypothetical protein
MPGAARASGSPAMKREVSARSNGPSGDSSCEGTNRRPTDAAAEDAIIGVDYGASVLTQGQPTKLIAGTHGLEAHWRGIGNASARGQVVDSACALGGLNGSVLPTRWRARPSLSWDVLGCREQEFAPLYAATAGLDGPASTWLPARGQG